MRELARTLMIRTLKEAIARPKTGSIADLKLQAEVALAGFEAEAKEQSLNNTEKAFKEEVKAIAHAVKSTIKKRG
jgi:hypothetical protein